ncbi:UNVERIFIED_CONTAM: hypothetical protein RMT77_019946 [Armadillidium vulgare]
MAYSENGIVELLFKGEEVPCICCGNSSCYNTPGDAAREDSLNESDVFLSSEKDSSFDSTFDHISRIKDYIEFNGNKVDKKINGNVRITIDGVTKRNSIEEWQERHPGLTKSYLETLRKFQVIQTEDENPPPIPKSPLQLLRKSIYQKPNQKQNQKPMISRRHTCIDDLLGNKPIKQPSPLARRGKSQTPSKKQRNEINQGLRSPSPGKWGNFGLKTSLHSLRSSRSRTRSTGLSNIQVINLIYIKS